MSALTVAYAIGGIYALNTAYSVYTVVNRTYHSAVWFGAKVCDGVAWVGSFCPAPDSNGSKQKDNDQRRNVNEVHEASPPQ